MYARDPSSKAVINTDDGYYKSILARRQDKKKTVEFDQTIVSIGEIGNIYISLGKIIQTYRNLANSDGVNITDLLTHILEDISFSLGGINDFKLYTNNKCDIVKHSDLLENKVQNLELDEEMVSTLDFVWSKPDRKSTRLNSSHVKRSRMPSSA